MDVTGMVQTRAEMTGLEADLTADLTSVLAADLAADLAVLWVASNRPVCVRTCQVLIRTNMQMILCRIIVMDGLRQIHQHFHIVLKSLFSFLATTRLRRGFGQAAQGPLHYRNRRIKRNVYRTCGCRGIG